MPKRRSPVLSADTPPASRGTFRNRYDDLENRRTQLVERLRRLGEIAKPHPGYKRALTLLNDTFRRSRLAQRLAVLQAAAWLIDVLEQVTTLL
jgi:hypothetical protein